MYFTLTDMKIKVFNCCMITYSDWIRLRFICRFSDASESSARKQATVEEFRQWNYPWILILTLGYGLTKKSVVRSGGQSHNGYTTASNLFQAVNSRCWQLYSLRQQINRTSQIGLTGWTYRWRHIHMFVKHWWKMYYPEFTSHRLE